MKNILGELLHRLRDKARIEVEKVAELLNVDEKTVNKWEKGEEAPSLSVKGALSILYNVPLSLFLMDYSTLDKNYIKTRTSVPKELSKLDEAMLQDRLNNVLKSIELFKTANTVLSSVLPKFEQLDENSLLDTNGHISQDSKAIIRKNTEIIKDYYSLPISGPTADPLERIRAVSLNIMFVELPEKFNGISFCLPDTGNFLIFINSKDSHIKQCFTLFHELGHIVFHFKDKDRYNEMNERICNCFANMALLPPQNVQVEFHGFKMSEFDLWVEKFKKVSEDYFVSYKTIFYALYHAGMITKQDIDAEMETLLTKHFQNNKSASNKQGFDNNESFEVKLRNLVTGGIISADKAEELSYYTLRIN